MAELSGIPYDELRWQPISGQPFGNGVGYNGIIFGNLSNIVDMEGPVAVEGNVNSYRGMSVSFGRGGAQTIPYDPKAVRFLAGGDVSIAGALTVVGNVVTAGNTFNVGTGSTYLIGMSGESDQRELLAQLYAADGSPYWEPASHNGYYVISSYDVPRYIPAWRLDADVPAFFNDAKASITCWHNAIGAMTATGATSATDYGYVFTGTDAQQNVFDLTWPEEGSIVGNLTFDVPESAVNIVRIYSGDTMIISTPLWGTESMAGRTLYVLMNAKTVNMPFPTAIYGSVLAPDTAWYAQTTGGNINGNTALGSLWVQEGSGFELHWHPFEGNVTGVDCDTPTPECPACPECPECPTCPDCPSCPECPACPDCPSCPDCPICPVTSGVIAGCLVPNGQCIWRIKLCDRETRCVLSVWQGCGMGCFSFDVDPEKHYSLVVDTCCHYELQLNNVGVRSLSLKS